MDSIRPSMVCYIIHVVLLLCPTIIHGLTDTQMAALFVDASPQSARKISDSMFGIFFEEINHSGAGGIWSELVSNRGFEAGGPFTPSNIDPWYIVGNETDIVVSTERMSCFARNEVALRMDVLCDDKGPNVCPARGVGVYNPGYWGMNIEKRKQYKVVLYIKSVDMVNLAFSLVSPDGTQKLASHTITKQFSDWTKVEFRLRSRGSHPNAVLQLTTGTNGTIWLDQVSLMPLDTFKGHGFRKELISMLADLKPQFLRFPGGSYVEGNWLRNAFRWKDTVGPWQERPGHFNDVWEYWTDDGLGFYEFLQLAEDLNASPVWVINNGASLGDHVPSSTISAFVKDVIDGIEFARGSSKSQWGSVRAAMGHPEPFQLNYISIGNQQCWMTDYLGNYFKFYSAIKAAYPDIRVVTNCDGSSAPLNHPADLYDVHVYTNSADMFSKSHLFDNSPRNGPKAFVSEYAVTGSDAGKGTLIAALTEAGFLIGLERNSDVVGMASCAPLLVNDNDRKWSPDAIVFNSQQQYGCPNYWMQHFFKDSSGATFHPSIIQPNNSNSIGASAITWVSSEDNNMYLKIKVVNIGNSALNLSISVSGLEYDIDIDGSIKTMLTSGSPLDENSFQQPQKVVPVVSSVPSDAGVQMQATFAAYSLTSFDLLLNSNHSCV